MSDAISTSSTTVTRGIRVIVSAKYEPQRSLPIARRYAFVYSVRIENASDVSVQLLGRHWRVTDGNGKVEEVQGAGVVGEQPILLPGGKFEYASQAVLQTSHGKMDGSYRMHDILGRTFDAAIAPFALTLPRDLN
jgi:ApaG protein